MKNDLNFRDARSVAPLPEHLPYADYIEEKYQGWRLSSRREVPRKYLWILLNDPRVPARYKSAIRFELMHGGY